MKTGLLHKEQTLEECVRYHTDVKTLHILGYYHFILRESVTS